MSTERDGSGMHGALILGPARCGSTMISRMLASHPAVLSLSELFAMVGPRAFRPAQCDGRQFWHALTAPLPGMSRIGNPDTAPDEFLYHLVPQRRHDPWNCPPLLAITLPHLFADPDSALERLRPVIEPRPRGPLAEHYLALFRALADLDGRRPGVWAERSGGSLAAAATLVRMFPHARRIVVLRNGPETALSLRDYAPARLAIWLWRHGLGLVDPISPRAHLGRGIVWPWLARLGGLMPLTSILNRRPTLRDCGRFWSALMTRGERSLAPHRISTLRYEDIMADPVRGVRHLGQLVAGDVPDVWCQRAAAIPQPRPSRLISLDREARRILTAACAEGEAAAARLEARSI